MDVNVSEQVAKMKRDLLKLIGVGEFSDSAEWKDPCSSFVIPEVNQVQSSCTHFIFLAKENQGLVLTDGLCYAVVSCVNRRRCVSLLTQRLSVVCL